MSSDVLLTDYYREQLCEKHRVSPWGGGGWRWIPALTQLMLKTSIERPTVLDYGAGRRTFAAKMKIIMPHVEVTEYDPAVPGINKLPEGRFDYVMCTDVMEHVERQFVDQTIRRIRQYARHGVVFNIALVKGTSRLPDGTSTHVTVESSCWWRDRIRPVFRSVEVWDPYLDQDHITLLATV